MMSDECMPWRQLPPPLSTLLSALSGHYKLFINNFNSVSYMKNSGGVLLINHQMTTPNDNSTETIDGFSDQER